MRSNTVIYNVGREITQWESFESRVEAHTWVVLSILITIATFSSELRALIGW